MSKTMNLNGRTIPLTKNGFPNKRYLNKAEKTAFETVLKKNAKMKEEELMKTFTELFNKK